MLRKPPFTKLLSQPIGSALVSPSPEGAGERGVTYLEFDFPLELTHNNDNQMFCLKGWGLFPCLPV